MKKLDFMNLQLTNAPGAGDLSGGSGGTTASTHYGMTLGSVDNNTLLAAAAL